MNIVKHYKNNHSECYHSAGYKKDNNYKPSRLALVQKFTEKLLLDVILSSNLYKYPEVYVVAKDTYYVESFNNTMNLFYDKRIAFGNQAYSTRFFWLSVSGMNQMHHTVKGAKGFIRLKHILNVESGYGDKWLFYFTSVPRAPYIRTVY